MEERAVTMTHWTYNEEKFTELLLHVATATADDPRGGAVKVNKYLYFADFAAMRILGRPITGAEYQKLPWGPAPRRLLPVRDRLISSGGAKLEQRVDAFGYEHDLLVPLREARLEVFDPSELAVVNDVIGALRDLTAVQVSDLSHHEAGWQLVEEGQTIAYELAFVMASDGVLITHRMRERGQQLLAKFGNRIA
jgi:uncharacterized phage-associated protein